MQNKSMKLYKNLDEVTFLLDKPKKGVLKIL